MILEKEMTITTQNQLFIKYLPIPPTICDLVQEWGYPKTLLSNSIKFTRQQEVMTQISIKHFDNVCYQSNQCKATGI